MTTKPMMMWHADGEGKCHAGCEARRSDAPGTWYCRICENLPWETFRDAPGDGSGCPFAVLVDVLCVHRPAHEPPMADLDLEHMMHLAWGCGYRFGRERPNDDQSQDIDRMNAEVHALIVHERSEVKLDEPPHEEKPDEDRRCGTCANTEQGCCPYMQVFDEKGTSVGRYVAAMAGPPWPNCRFWRKR